MQEATRGLRKELPTFWGCQLFSGEQISLWLLLRFVRSPSSRYSEALTETGNKLPFTHEGIEAQRRQVTFPRPQSIQKLGRVPFFLFQRCLLRRSEAPACVSPCFLG